MQLFFKMCLRRACGADKFFENFHQIEISNSPHKTDKGDIVSNLCLPVKNDMKSYGKKSHNVPYSVLE